MHISDEVIGEVYRNLEEAKLLYKFMGGLILEAEAETK